MVDYLNDHGIISNPDDDGCPVCKEIHHQGIMRDIDDVLYPLRDVFYNPLDIGTEMEWLMVEGGQVSRDYLIGNLEFQRFVDRRPEGMDDLATPMFHIVDERTGEFREYSIKNQLAPLGDSLREMVEERPWMCSRHIMKFIFRMFLRWEIGLSIRTARQLRDPNILPPGRSELAEHMENLQPELKHGEFQKARWIDAFEDAYTLR